MQRTRNERRQARQLAAAAGALGLLCALVLLMELASRPAEPAETPEPEAVEAQAGPEPGGPVEIRISGLDGADLADVYVAIPVEGMEEVRRDAD